MTLALPRALGRPDLTDEFDCGNPELDAWLRRYAWMADAAGTARTHVVCDRDGQVRAYYALSPGAVRRADVPARLGRGAPDPIGVILLARSAVDRSLQGQGVGSALVRDAAVRALAAAELVGARALVVHAADDHAGAFYRRLDFQPFPSDPLHLGVLMKDLRRRYG